MGDAYLTSVEKDRARALVAQGWPVFAAVQQVVRERSEPSWRDLAREVEDAPQGQSER